MFFMGGVLNGNVSLGLAENILPSFVRLRDKYPSIMGAKDELPKIKRLILAGKDDEAEAIAKAYVRSRPRLRVRDAVAVRHRAMRREFLKFQRDTEKTVRAIFQAMADKAEKSILAAAGDDGKIPLWKINPLIKRLKQLNTEGH